MGDEDNQNHNKKTILAEHARMFRVASPTSGREDPMREMMRRAIESGLRESVGGFRPNPAIFSGTFHGIQSIDENGHPTNRRETSWEYDQAEEKVEDWLHDAPEQSFDDIAGNTEALNQLKHAITAPVTHKELYEAYGMKSPKGALLSGPPGCGKTMFARAAAAEMRKLYGEETQFLLINGTEIQSPYVGVAEQKVKSIFNFAKLYKEHHGHPLLVFIDEADALLPDRNGPRMANWEKSMVATFLAEMDGVIESGAFVMLATNRPHAIDQAVLRDGRCDFKITVSRPDQTAIETILRNNFEGSFTQENIEDLVFAGVECFYDPNMIIAHAHALGLDHQKQEAFEAGEKHFCLEHIVSGAMAASIPQRAARRAFLRDSASGPDAEITGIKVEDVIGAVRDVFEENKGLSHPFAMQEFEAEFHKEMVEKHGKRLKK